jgi:hypothetical protein
MGAGQWFWILVVLSVLFSGWAYYPFAQNYRPFGATLVMFVLICLLGFHVFGSPVK